MPLKSILPALLLILVLGLFSYTQQTTEPTAADVPLSYRQVGMLGGPYVYFDDVAVDTNGNVYVPEEWMNRVRVYAPDGQPLDVLGEDGNGDFYVPYVVTLDSSGNVYVGDVAGAIHIFDSNHQHIRTIGGPDETDPRYQFTYPVSEIAIGDDGKFYIALPNENRVRIFDADWNPLGVIDDGPGEHFLVADVDVASDGTIYVLENVYSQYKSFKRVHLYNSDFSYRRSLNTGYEGHPNWDLNGDGGWLDIGPDGKIYVVNTPRNIIKVFNSDLTYFGAIGTGVRGSGPNEFQDPAGLAFGPDGAIYIADTGNWRIVIRNPDLSYYGLFPADAEINNQFGSPFGVTIGPDDTLFVADTYRNRVQVYNSQVHYIATMGTGFLGSGDYAYYFPHDTAFGPDGKIYVADAFNQRVQIYNADFTYYGTISGGDWLVPGDLLSAPLDVALDAAGNLYIADTFESRVIVLNPDYSYKGVIGTGEYGSENIQVSEPFGIAFAADGKILVADRLNHRIQIFNADLSYAFTLGITGVPGDDNQHFDYPTDVTVASDGTIFVGDVVNNRIQIFNADYSYRATVHIDPNPDQFQESQNFDVAVDSLGRVFVADSTKNRVLIFAANATPVAQPDSYTIASNTTLTTTPSDGVLANDSDPDFEALTATLVDGPNHATTFNFNLDGTFTYTPESHFNGQDSFTYQASDGLIFSAETSVTITVGNIPPEETDVVPVEPTMEVDPEVIFFVTDEPGSRPPYAPQNLTVDPRQGRPRLTWTDDVHAEWFHLYIASGDYSTQLLDTWVAREEYCEDSLCAVIPPLDLVAGSYHVWMQAWGFGEFSIGGHLNYKGWSYAPFTLSNTPPSAVSEFTGTMANGQLTLGWTAPTGATWYNVWVGTGSPDWTLVLFIWLGADDLGCGAGGLCTWEDIPLVDGTYVWYIKAWGPGGFSTGGLSNAPGWSQGPNITVNN